VKAGGEPLDARELLKDRRFATKAGLGRGLFRRDRLLGALSVDLGPRKVSQVRLGFDHSNLKPNTAAMLHVAQWSEDGRIEGGITIVALAPKR
jgi:hypothetical protein